LSGLSSQLTDPARHWAEMIYKRRATSLIAEG
jgi:hypothetical protein